MINCPIFTTKGKNIGFLQIRYKQLGNFYAFSLCLVSFVYRTVQNRKEPHMTKRKAVSTLRDAFESSSVHGLRYVAKKGPPWERGYWLMALVSGIVMAFLVINKSSRDWEVMFLLITSNTIIY